MPIRDTSASAQALHLQIQRAMSGEQRFVLAFEMSLFARDLAAARIRQQNPEWPEKQVAHELLRQSFLPLPLPEQIR
jgi:hypothetical protein